MDLFIDKLAQKISATEMIKANTSAEAKETEKLREQVEGYESLLQEMKLINLKNMESAEKLNSLAKGCAEAAEAANGAAKTAMDATNEAKAIIDEVARININDESDEGSNELFEKTTDVIHRENVKVYRNIQASMQSSLEDQTKAIIDSQNETGKKNSVGFLKVMSVLIFVAVLADIALKVLSILGIL